MTRNPEPVDRRRLIVGVGATLAIGYGAVKSGWLNDLLPVAPFDFVDMAKPAGFRLLTGGATTGISDPFIGLDTEQPAETITADTWVDSNLCAALFSQNPAGVGQVPMAYFFDYQCPICRRLTPRLRNLNGVVISWHDLAGLGPTSRTAAQASIAARAQGAYDSFHDRLMRSRFQANEGYIISMAQSIGIDPDRLLADMDSDAVRLQMLRSQALARLFGMPGTPGMVIGSTVIIGNLSDRDLNRVVVSEQTRTQNCG